jgi:hypothetical protein
MFFGCVFILKVAVLKHDFANVWLLKTKYFNSMVGIPIVKIDWTFPVVGLIGEFPELVPAVVCIGFIVNNGELHAVNLQGRTVKNITLTSQTLSLEKVGSGTMNTMVKLG